eukprot:6180663-Pleurochrysis_carterae.AAC.2
MSRPVVFSRLPHCQHRSSHPRLGASCLPTCSVVVLANALYYVAIAGRLETSISQSGTYAPPPTEQKHLAAAGRQVAAIRARACAGGAAAIAEIAAVALCLAAQDTLFVEKRNRDKVFVPDVQLRPVPPPASRLAGDGVPVASRSAPVVLLSCQRLVHNPFAEKLGVAVLVDEHSCGVEPLQTKVGRSSSQPHTWL